MPAELTPEDKTLLELVKRRVCHFEDTLGKHYRDGLWARMDKLYHGWTQMRQALRNTSGRNRDDIYGDARNEFGHELFIPHAFAIVETVLPALISNRPRILILPRGEASARNVEHMKAQVDAQQGQIGMELRFQTAAKQALMYGIGPGKSYWLRREGKRERLEELSRIHPARAIGKTHHVVTCAEPLFDDPTFESIPVRDFFWDPFAADIENARWAAHRTWRDADYVNARLSDEAGWVRIPLSKEDIETGNGSAELYRKSVKGPFEAQGIPIPSPMEAREADIHEVIEYHDRAQIVTVLDRAWIVDVTPNETNYGRLPFPTFRPTEVPNQMVGKGEIEPVEDLQAEMNAKRTSRWWADEIALNPVLFYNDGLIEPDKIRVGPGELNAVNGDPRDIIWQLDIHPPTNNSVRETAEIANDIVRTSGVSDAFSGGDAGSQATATGVQLQMARASARIQNKTRRAEIELMRPVGEHWVRLNQRHILEQREVRVPAPPVPGEPERRWSWFALGPNELAGEFDIEIDGGSTTPLNEPMMRQDAQILMTIMGSPVGQLFDPRQMAIRILEKMGEKNPEAMLNSGAIVPPETLDLIAQHLAELGMDPAMAQQLVQASLQEVLDMKDEQAQAADHGGGEGPPEGEPEAEEQQAA